MRKSILAMGMALAVFAMSGMTSYAADGATVSFTPENKLEYSGVTMKDGEVNLGDAFEGVAPGETRTQTITVKNENSRTADFYMSAEAVKALEEETEKAKAKGAGYEIELKIIESPEKSTVLYDSTVGGYGKAEDTSASGSGIKGMNSALEDYILIATLKQGESRDVELKIAFDGEAMDNTDAINYTLTNGQLAFNFKVGYEDPTGTTVIVREVTEDGQVRYVKRVVEILENGVPLGAVATGDGAMIGIAVAVLAVGGILLVLGRKKKAEEEA